MDEEHDRMLVIGADVADVWALPLSGPNQHQWSQVVAEGDYPSPPQFDAGQERSAIYDPFGRRLLVLVADSYQFKSPRLWELTLGDTPTWHELLPDGPSPGGELDFGKMVVDRENKRALVVGGGLNGSGTWALSLDGAPRWSRIGDAPSAGDRIPGPFPLGVAGTLLLDARRAQLVLISVPFPRAEAKVWRLPLAGGAWTLEGQAACGPDYDRTTTYDSTNDRAIFLGGTCGITTYSLSTGEWQTTDSPSPSPFSSLTSTVSSVTDDARGRALFFSGGLSAGNLTAALRFDDLTVSVLVPNTRGTPAGGTTGIWDPQRESVVSFGSFDESGNTSVHGLAASDHWRVIDGPRPFAGTAIYDPEGKAIVAFGGNPYIGPTSEVARLPSQEGAKWTIVPVPDGPGARAGHVAVYDPIHRQMVIHGGAYNNDVPVALDDTWAFNLEGEPKWTLLSTTGDSGSALCQHVAVYDPVGQRMIVYGGEGCLSADSAEQPGDLHALALDGSLHWTELHASGKGPLHQVVRAVYDPKGQRMIVLDSGHVLALELTFEPTWHRFCEAGLPQPGPRSFFENGLPCGTRCGVALVPDGLFTWVDDGTFRFDLDTPYCD